MKLKQIIRLIVEFLVSFFIKKLIQVNVPITGQTQLDTIIYSVISYGILVISVINFISVNIIKKRKYKIGTIENLLFYSGGVIASVGLWYLFNIWIFWVVFGVSLLVYLIFYIKNREYRKELYLYKKQIRRSIKLEYGITLRKMKVLKENESIISAKIEKDNYYVIVLLNEDIIDTQELLPILEQSNIMQTLTEENYVYLRYISLFMLKNVTFQHTQTLFSKIRQNHTF